MAKPNVPINLMKLTSAASEALSNTVRRLAAAILSPNGHVLTANAFLSNNIVMERATAETSLMKPWENVVSKDSRCSLPKNVVVKMINGNVLTPVVFPNLVDATVKLSAETSQMKSTSNAASWIIHSITLKSVAATLRLNGHAPMASASVRVRSVTEEPSAPTDPMKETKTAALENSLSTTTKNVAAKKINGNVPTVIVLAKIDTVMAKPNAKMAPMKVRNNAATEVSDSTMRKCVDVTLRLNGPVPMVSAFLTTTTVMANINVPINLMKLWRTAASESTSTTALRSVAATLIANGPVLMVIVSLSKVFAMVKLSAVTNLTIATKSAVSRDTNSTPQKSVAATLILSGPVPTVNVLKTAGSVMERLIVSTDLMRDKVCLQKLPILNVASKASKLIILRSVAATLRLNGLVLTVNVFLRMDSATAKLSALIVLMK
jgi:hypothetical protein